MNALAGLLVAIAVARSDDVGFPARAAELRQSSGWAELVRLADERLREEPEDRLALANLAVGRAGMQEFAGAVDGLKRLAAAGQDPASALEGFGSPLGEVVNAVYGHCWANYDAAFNRKCWQALFDAYPESPHVAGTPASRLLMAALKQDDAAAIETLEAYYDRLLARAAEQGTEDHRTLMLYAQAYVRAGRRDARMYERARLAFERAWRDAAERERFDADVPLDDDMRARRDRCDVECDTYLNVLTQAAVLGGRTASSDDPPEDPLLAREPEPGVVFEDVTEAFGLAEVRSGRVAVGDYDSDGDPDVCFQGRLFRNDHAERFVEVTTEAGLGPGGNGALFGDVDDDGDLDLLVLGVKPRLFANTGPRGRFAFEDATAAFGLDAVTLPAPPEGATLFDANGDGRLDVYLAVYEEPMATGHPDWLLVNDGTRFTDASDSLGVRAPPAACSRGVATADFDDDGDVDLHVSNYRLNPNRLFRNDGATFVDVGEATTVRGTAERYPQYFGHTIGSCFGDVDGDGDLDLFSANLAHPRYIQQGFSNQSCLYVNGGGGAFTEERSARGVRFQETHSDPALVDVDGDGDLDLSITCIYEGVPSALYENDGTGRFAPITRRAGAIVFNGWGQAWFDLDDDGDVDVLFASSSGVRLFRNRGNENNWLKVRLAASGRNRFGIGARVTVETPGDAPVRVVRELSTARGTTSQDGHELHFGLGTARGRMRVTVRWPDGFEQTTTAFPNRTTTIRRSSAGR